MAVTGKRTIVCYYFGYRPKADNVQLRAFRVSHGFHGSSNRQMAIIRPATADDARLVLELITALAEHHGQTEYVQTDQSALRAAGFGDEPKFGVLLAEVDGITAGFLSYTICYSIWHGDSFMQIDDVFVRDEFRGNGVGESLMNESHQYCKKLGLQRVKWEVQPDNAAAIRFYERLGARSYDKRLFIWSVE